METEPVANARFTPEPVNATFSLRQGGFTAVHGDGSKGGGAPEHSAAPSMRELLPTLWQALQRTMPLLLGGAAMLAAVFWAVLMLQWAMQHEQWQVRQVELVPGQKMQMYRNDVLQEQALAWLNHQALQHQQPRCSLVYCDIMALKKYLESLPWIRRVVVRKHYPNGLRLLVQEHQALAYWGIASDATMMNQYGELFSARWEDAEPRNLPVLFGADGQSSALAAQDGGDLGSARLLPQVVDTAHNTELYRRWQRWDALMWPLHLRMTHLSQDSFGSWHAVLSNGAKLQLGQGESAVLQARLENFVTSVESASKSYAGSVEDVLLEADLRYPNGYALRLKGIQTLSEQPEPGSTPRL